MTIVTKKCDFCEREIADSKKVLYYGLVSDLDTKNMTVFKDICPECQTKLDECIKSLGSNSKYKKR